MRLRLHLRLSATSVVVFDTHPLTIHARMHTHTCTKIDKEKSKISASPRCVILVLEKAEEETWPRLTKESGRHLTHIKVDWDKWVDSDDEGDADGFDLSSMGDFSSLGGMGGMMGGMGGMGGMMGGMGGMMGGMGGMGGMDFSALGGMDGAAADEAGAAVPGDDSDDEDLPKLESSN
jgi:hypothetical protein